MSSLLLTYIYIFVFCRAPHPTVSRHYCCHHYYDDGDDGCYHHYCNYHHYYDDGDDGCYHHYCNYHHYYDDGDDRTRPNNRGSICGHDMIQRSMLLPSMILKIRTATKIVHTFFILRDNFSIV